MLTQISTVLHDSLPNGHTVAERGMGTEDHAMLTAYMISRKSTHE